VHERIQTGSRTLQGVVSYRGPAVDQSFAIQPTTQVCADAGVYALLGRLFERDLTLEEMDSIASQSVCSELSALTGLGVDARAIGRILERFSTATTETVVRLSTEFQSLFLMDNHIFACASCWVARRPNVTGVPWEQALHFYREHGVSIRSDKACAADHAGTELYVASLLAERVAEATTEDAAASALSALRDLLDVVILPWMPEFLLEVELDERADFYRDAACVTRELLALSRHAVT